MKGKRKVPDDKNKSEMQWGKTKTMSLKSGNKIGMPTFTSLIQFGTASPSHSNQTRRNERQPNWKGRSKNAIIRR